MVLMPVDTSYPPTPPRTLNVFHSLLRLLSSTPFTHPLSPTLSPLPHLPYPLPYPLSPHTLSPIPSPLTPLPYPLSPPLSGDFIVLDVRNAEEEEGSYDRVVAFRR